jgi:hypothetical protein
MPKFFSLNVYLALGIPPLSDEFDFHKSTYHMIPVLTITVVVMAANDRFEVPLFHVSSVGR